jgi:putative peptidoglycan lipid II flippase
MLLANCVMVAVIYQLMTTTEHWLQMALWDRILEMAILVVAGLVTYTVTIILAGLRPKHLRHA